MLHQVVNDRWPVPWESICHQTDEFLFVQRRFVFILVFVVLTMVFFLSRLHQRESFAWAIHTGIQVISHRAVVARLSGSSSNTLTVFVGTGWHHARPKSTSIGSLFRLRAHSCYCLVHHKEVDRRVASLGCWTHCWPSNWLPEVSTFADKRILLLELLLLGHCLDDFWIGRWENF